jgi:hypothetical protein
MVGTYLKKKIFVSDQSEAKHQPTGILAYFEDLMRGFNPDMERKDFFKIGSNMNQEPASTPTSGFSFMISDEISFFQAEDASPQTLMEGEKK